MSKEGGTLFSRLFKRAPTPEAPITIEYFAVQPTTEAVATRTRQEVQEALNLTDTYGLEHISTCDVGPNGSSDLHLVIPSLLPATDLQVDLIGGNIVNIVNTRDGSINL